MKRGHLSSQRMDTARIHDGTGNRLEAYSRSSDSFYGIILFRTRANADSFVLAIHMEGLFAVLHKTTARPSPLLHAFRRESFHCFTKYRPWYSYIKTHEALTAWIECFSVVQSKAGFVHEKIHKIVMSKSKGTTV